MHWDRKNQRWSSVTKEKRPHLTDAQRAERKELIKMSLFRKKKAENESSAFDLIPVEVQGKLIEDVLLIARTIKAWPSVVPPELHFPITNEVAGMLRKTGLKLAGFFLANPNDLESDGFAEAFKGVQLPQFIRQVIVAVQLATNDKFIPPGDGGPDGKAA